MNEFIQQIADSMAGSLAPQVIVFLLSMVPIIEARGAIMLGVSMHLKPYEAFGWAFLGSSLTVPILLLILIPTINALSKTKFFSKIGKFLYDKFASKTKSMTSTETDDAQTTASGKKRLITKSEWKRMGGAALFVAVPLPLTGVWTGSAVASITKLGYVKALISIIFGNAVACGILTLISFLFEPYVNYITLAFFIIAIVVVIVLIIKLIIYKPKDGAQTETQANVTTENQSTNQTQTDKISSHDINNNVANESTRDKEE